VKIDWIISSQNADDIRKYPGPVVWVSKCLRCGAEEPAYEGGMEVEILASKLFISSHKNCKERGEEDGRESGGEKGDVAGKS
jgi:hypothetical protein